MKTAKKQTRKTPAAKAPVKYPCQKHPDVLRDHPMRICWKCEQGMDRDLMRTISDPH